MLIIAILQTRLSAREIPSHDFVFTCSEALLELFSFANQVRMSEFPTEE